MNEARNHFGEHLTLDGYNGDFDKLNDRLLVRQCLDELPDLVGMKKLAEPEVYFAPANSKKDCGGWTGFTVIAESHISIHTFPKRGFVSIDIYTCRSGLDQKFLINYFVEKFKLKKTEINFLIRGIEYPLQDIY
jgi:S-adenosylmethionine decarboxylase